MTTPRIGLIGLGVISRFYLAALAHEAPAELAAVCDPDETGLAGAPPGVPRYRNHHELLRHADVDAVVVNVPNDLHYPVCRDALAAGRAVCVEKPLTTKLSDARHLARLSLDAGVPLFTSFHRRYNTEVNALRERIAAQAPISSLTVRYEEMIEEHAGQDRWYLDPDRCGGGCVADNGPNAFDLVRLFVGDVRVTEAAVHRDAHGVDRQATVLLGAASGAVARVELDWSYPGERKTIEARLADGTVHTADMLAGHPEFKGSLWHEYVGVLRDFTDVLAGRRTAGPPHGPDGLAALELVADTYAHERAGRSPSQQEATRP
ncbi:Gfo/Idh/MocA family protein [Streptomyces ochraceiscleroticus]|uniref:Gfo/Idh/MocA family protein n=1 Tax=Streptomyces ochraceiscleroticus TaxID=47761 RepID=A0ABW1MU51_9ACTN|nr:Gfo/Idh/MocA family oxidoreductase [Streptomyces ochraceiscleroticus]